MLQEGGQMKRKLSFLIVLLLVPAVVLAGLLLFDGKQYAFTSAAVVTLAVFAFFLSFEKKENAGTKLVLIAVMTALSVAGRIVFAAIPAFKPVTAVVIITAIYFGREAGFMTGALSAVLSNFYFGQGQWTPFQMLTWGLIGWLAGLLAAKLKTSRALLSAYGFVAGISFSLLMDIWSTLWFDGGFNLSRYLTLVVSALPHTLLYAASNIVFLLMLNKPVGKKLDRIKIKYGL